MILKPLREGDLHHLSGLRVPANNEQREFDELTLSLTKILIDSINEKSLESSFQRIKRRSQRLNYVAGNSPRFE